ncbi:hypothetical protein Tco_1334537 [Tanacetum coccineum]
MANHFSFDVKSFKKAVIEVQTIKDYELGDDNFVADLFAQVSHVEHLSINHDFIKEWSYLRGGLTTIDRDYGRIITRRPQSPCSGNTDFIMEGSQTTTIFIPESHELPQDSNVGE